MRKIVFLFCFSVLSITTTMSFAQNDEIRIVSPIGAAVRSAFLPGWGQIYTENKIRGSILFVSCGAILTSGFISRKSYQNNYQNYKNTAEALDNPQDCKKIHGCQELYDKANQRFKLSQFLFFSSIGVWAYSIIDSYVNANFYNAQAKSKKLLDDTKKIENMEFQLDLKSEQINLILTANF